MGFCTTSLLVLHLWSVHETHGHNNANYGAGYECRNDESGIIAQAGAYDNSFNRTTTYAAVGLEPARVRLGKREFVGGFLAGWATGYKQPAIGGFRIRTALTESTELAVMFAPSTGSTSGVYHLTLSWRFM